MPPNPHDSRLHRAAAHIAQPVKFVAKRSYYDVIQPIAGTVEHLNDKTKKPVEDALNAAKIEAAQQLQQTDAGRGAVAAARFVGGAANNLSQFRASAKQYYGTRGEPGIKQQYAHRPAKENLRRVNRNRRQSYAQERSLHHTARIANRTHRIYMTERSQLRGQFLTGAISYHQYTQRLQTLRDRMQPVMKIKPKAPAINRSKVTLVRPKKKYRVSVAKTQRLDRKHLRKFVRGRKKAASAQNRAFRKFRKISRKAIQTERKLYRSRENIRKLAKPKSESGRMITQSVKRAMRNQAAQDAGDNDAVQAAMKIAEFAEVASAGQRSKKLKEEKKRESKLKKRSGLQDQKLKQRQSQLHKTSIANQQGKKPPKTRRTVKQFVQDTAKEIKREVLAIAGKMVIPIILIAFFCFSCVAPFVGIADFVESSTWMIGTFNALDKDLSDAEKYYLKLAYDYDANTVLCGDASSWKGGLNNFGVNTSGYKKKPALFSNTSTAADAFEFDVWKIWSYLCAYRYTYNSTTKESEMWQFDDEAKHALDLLFMFQYEFTHTYLADGYWERIDGAVYDATFLSMFNAGSSTVMRGVFTFTSDTLPSELSAWAENHDGTYWLIYNLSNNEILNANDSFAATGWYFDYNLADIVGGTCHYRQYYQWVNTTALYYGINKKRGLDEAIQIILSNMSNDIYQYYLVLANGSETGSGSAIKLYGGHQAIRSPITSTMKQLMEGGRILHNFGMDMPDGQQWGSMHCDMGSSHYEHNGIDIVCNSGVAVYAMFTGKITDMGNGVLELSATDEEYRIHIWINENDTMQLRATYCAITPLDTLSKGNIVQEGQLIGYTTRDKKCESNRSFDAGWDYLHIKLEMKYDTVTFKTVDPRLLIS